MSEPVRLIPIATQVKLVGPSSKFAVSNMKYYVSKYITSKETLHVELTWGSSYHPIIVPFEDVEVLPRDTIPVHEIEELSTWLRERALDLPAVVEDPHLSEQIIYEVITKLAEMLGKGRVGA